MQQRIQQRRRHILSFESCHSGSLDCILVFHSDFYIIFLKTKSPKGHWSLTWVQWALLLKVRFLSKSESMTAIFVKSVRQAQQTIAIFIFSSENTFDSLLLQTTTLIRNHEYNIPTKFPRNPSRGYVKEVENAESLRTDRQWTDGALWQ